MSKRKRRRKNNKKKKILLICIIMFCMIVVSILFFAFQTMFGVNAPGKVVGYYSPDNVFKEGANEVSVSVTASPVVNSGSWYCLAPSASPSKWEALEKGSYVTGISQEYCEQRLKGTYGFSHNEEIPVCDIAYSKFDMEWVSGSGSASTSDGSAILRVDYKHGLELDKFDVPQGCWGDCDPGAPGIQHHRKENLITPEMKYERGFICFKAQSWIGSVNCGNCGCSDGIWNTNGHGSQTSNGKIIISNICIFNNIEYKTNEETPKVCSNSLLSWNKCQSDGTWISLQKTCEFGCENGICLLKPPECVQDIECINSFKSCFSYCNKGMCLEYNEENYGTIQGEKPCINSTWLDYPDCKWICNEPPTINKIIEPLITDEIAEPNESYEPPIIYEHYEPPIINENTSKYIVIASVICFFILLTIIIVLLTKSARQKSKKKRKRKK